MDYRAAPVRPTACREPQLRAGGEPSCPDDVTEEMQ